MTTQTVSGEEAVTMVLEGINDADDQALAQILRTLLNQPVRVVSDNKFEIEWPRGTRL